MGCDGPDELHFFFAEGIIHREARAALHPPEEVSERVWYLSATLRASEAITGAILAVDFKRNHADAEGGFSTGRSGSSVIPGLTDIFTQLTAMPPPPTLAGPKGSPPLTGSMPSCPYQQAAAGTQAFACPVGRGAPASSRRTEAATTAGHIPSVSDYDALRAKLAGSAPVRSAGFPHSLPGVAWSSARRGPYGGMVSRLSGNCSRLWRVAAGRDPPGSSAGIPFSGLEAGQRQIVQRLFRSPGSRLCSPSASQAQCARQEASSACG